MSDDRCPMQVDPANMQALDVVLLKKALRGMRDWNGGAGLIVPPALAAKWRALGVTEHYTVQNKIPNK